MIRLKQIYDCSSEVTGFFVLAGVRESSLWREASMPMKEHKLEQIVTILQQIEVGLANGKTSPSASIQP
jgi:hypothetical protein